MLNFLALTFLFAGQYVPNYTLEDYEFRTGFKIECQQPVPEGFACAVILSIDPPLPDGVASIVAGENNEIRRIGLVLNGTLYTAIFDPPIKRVDHFSGIKRNNPVPARVDEQNLIIRWPDGTQSRAKIIRREVAEPTQPQPA